MRRQLSRRRLISAVGEAEALCLLADAARAQGGRIVWIDRSGASGRLYCISRS